MSVKSGKLLTAEDLLQSHICVDKTLPKVGTKEFKPTGSWLEKKQIQTALDECKQLLDEERVEKLGALAEAYWNDKKKLAEVTRKVGKHWQTMGFETHGKYFLFPEEALHLLETNCLQLTFNDVPISIQQGYSILLSGGSGCTLKEYRAYAHLMRQGFRLLRHTKFGQPTNYEHRIRLDQNVSRKRVYPEANREENARTNSSNLPSGEQSTSTDTSARKSDGGTDSQTGKKAAGGDPWRKATTELVNRCFMNQSRNGGTRRGETVEINQGEVSISRVKCESDEEMEEEPEETQDYVKQERSRTPGTMKDFAQSIVNMGKSLIKTEDEADDEELGLDNLREKILDMLENHFQGQISPEAMDAVSLSASRAIMAHVSNDNSDEKLASTDDAEESADAGHRGEEEETTSPSSDAIGPLVGSQLASEATEIDKGKEANADCSDVQNSTKEGTEKVASPEMKSSESPAGEEATTLPCEESVVQVRSEVSSEKEVAGNTEPNVESTPSLEKSTDTCAPTEKSVETFEKSVETAEKSDDTAEKAATIAEKSAESAEKLVETVEKSNETAEKAVETAVPDETESLPVEDKLESAVQDEDEALPDGKSPKSAAQGEVETVPPKIAAQDGKEPPPVIKSSETAVQDKSENRLSTDKDVPNESTAAPNENSTKIVEQEETDKESNCDIFSKDVPESPLNTENKTDVTSQPKSPRQSEIGDSSDVFQLDNTKKVCSEGNEGNFDKESSETITNNAEAPGNESASAEKELVITVEKKANESNISENPKDQRADAMETTDESKTRAIGDNHDDILEWDDSDTEIEELSPVVPHETCAELMSIDDDIVEIEDPHSWKNVKVTSIAAPNESRPQKRVYGDSNGWWSYKQSLSDRPRKKARGPEGDISITQVLSNADIELIDISEESCIKETKPSISGVALKKEIQVVDLDESENSETDDSGTEDIIETKPNIKREKENEKENEKKPPKLVSAFERARDLRRKAIMEAFPDMADKAAITVSVPPKHLLPPNVNPVQAMYTVHRQRQSLISDRYHRNSSFSSFFQRGQFRRYYQPNPRFNNHMSVIRNNHPRQLNPHRQPHHLAMQQSPRFNAAPQMWQGMPLIQNAGNMPVNPVQAFQMITSILLPMFGIPPNYNQFPGQQPLMQNNNQWNQMPPWQQQQQQQQQQQLLRRNLNAGQNSQPWRFQQRPHWNFNRPIRNWQPRHDRPNFHSNQDRGSTGDQEEVLERPKRPALVNTPRPALPWVDARNTTCEPVQSDVGRPKRPFVFDNSFGVRKAPTASDLLSDIKDEIRWKKVQKMNACSDSDSSSSECSEQVTITPVRRPSDSQTELRPLLRMDQCTDSASIMASLQVIAKADFGDFTVSGQCRVLKISFDIYQPNAPFKKSQPSKPSFRLCVMGVEEPVPSPGEISILLEGIQDDVPLIFALVHPDDVSFFHYSGVDIPKQMFSS